MVIRALTMAMLVIFFAWSLACFFYTELFCMLLHGIVQTHKRFCRLFMGESMWKSRGCANLTNVSWGFGPVSTVQDPSCLFPAPNPWELIRDILLFIFPSSPVSKNLNLSKFVCTSLLRFRLIVSGWRWAWWTPSVWGGEGIPFSVLRMESLLHARQVLYHCTIFQPHLS